MFNSILGSNLIFHCFKPRSCSLAASVLCIVFLASSQDLHLFVREWHCHEGKCVRQIRNILIELEMACYICSVFTLQLLEFCFSARVFQCL